MDSRGLARSGEVETGRPMRFPAAGEEELVR